MLTTLLTTRKLRNRTNLKTIPLDFIRVDLFLLDTQQRADKLLLMDSRRLWGAGLWRLLGGVRGVGGALRLRVRAGRFGRRRIMQTPVATRASTTQVSWSSALLGALLPFVSFRRTLMTLLLE
jgi:hypothetical protein